MDCTLEKFDTSPKSKEDYIKYYNCELKHYVPKISVWSD